MTLGCCPSPLSLLAFRWVRWTWLLGSPWWMARIPVKAQTCSKTEPLKQPLPILTTWLGTGDILRWWTQLLLLSTWIESEQTACMHTHQTHKEVCDSFFQSFSMNSSALVSQWLGVGRMEKSELGNRREDKKTSGEEEAMLRRRKAIAERYGHTNTASRTVERERLFVRSKAFSGSKWRKAQSFKG